MTLAIHAGRHYYAVDAAYYAAGGQFIAPANTGQNLTHLRGQYRQQLTSWLQGRGTHHFGASKRYRAQMEATELHNGMSLNADSSNYPPYRRR